MKDKEIKELIEKYEAGSSSLNEEQLLFDKAEHTDSGISAWSTFVKSNKIEASQGLNNSIWKTFINRKVRKRRYTVGITSIAASIALIITLSLSNSIKDNSYNEKEAALNEALSMFARTEQEKMQQSIIYENEMIIIFTSLE